MRADGQPENKEDVEARKFTEEDVNVVETSLEKLREALTGMRNPKGRPALTETESQMLDNFEKLYKLYELTDKDKTSPALVGYCQGELANIRDNILPGVQALLVKGNVRDIQGCAGSIGKLVDMGAPIVAALKEQILYRYHKKDTPYSFQMITQEEYDQKDPKFEVKPNIVYMYRPTTRPRVITYILRNSEGQRRGGTMDRKTLETESINPEKLHDDIDMQQRALKFIRDDRNLYKSVELDFTKLNAFIADLVEQDDKAAPSFPLVRKILGGLLKVAAGLLIFAITVKELLAITAIKLVVSGATAAISQSPTGAAFLLSAGNTLSYIAANYVPGALSQMLAQSSAVLFPVLGSLSSLGIYAIGRAIIPEEKPTIAKGLEHFYKNAVAQGKTLEKGKFAEVKGAEEKLKKPAGGGAG